jgi:hypothetical protein
LIIDYEQKIVKFTGGEGLNFFNLNERKYDRVNGIMKRYPYEMFYVNVLMVQTHADNKGAK